MDIRQALQLRQNGPSSYGNLVAPFLTAYAMQMVSVGLLGLAFAVALSAAMDLTGTQLVPRWRGGVWIAGWLVPLLLLWLVAGYAVAVARRTRDGESRSFPHWRNYKIRQYLRWGFHVTLLPLLLIGVLPVLPARVLFGANAAGVTWWQQWLWVILPALALLVMALLVPPAVAYVRHDTFRALVSPRSWMAMVRRPFRGMWLKLFLLGVAFILLQAVDVVTIMIPGVGPCIPLAAFLVTYTGVAYALLLGQAARALDDADAADGAAPSDGSEQVVST